MSQKLYIVGRSIFEDYFTRNIVDMLLLQVELNIHDQHLHLIQDAVISAKKGNSLASKITTLIEKGVRVSVQKEDVLARGNFDLIPGVEINDYDALVDLIFDCEKICSNI